MDELIQKLTKIIRKNYPGAKIELDPNWGERVGGHMVWKGFDAGGSLGRQRTLGAVLRENLTKEEYRKVGPILTLTPEELKQARENGHFQR